jgi:hypothetical protein
MAAITDYSTLQTEVASWLHRADLTSTIQGLITLAEERVYRELRVRQMETTFSSAISSGVIALPTSYLELKNAYVDGATTQALQKKDAEWIYYNYPIRAADSKPKFIGRESTNFIFGPYPDSAYTIKGTYYKRLDALSGTNTTNWLVTDNPSLILFATLCEAAPYLVNDPRIGVWEAKYQAGKRAVELQDVQEEFSGSPLAMVAR